MADYNRFVSYLYEYRQGNKENNVGYAKVENRNNQCKVMGNIRLRRPLNGNFEVAMYYRPGETVQYVTLGTVSLRGGSGEWQFQTAGDNIGSGGHGLEEMCGILIRLDGNYIGSEWDDREVPNPAHPVQEAETEAEAEAVPVLGAAEMIGGQGTAVLTEVWESDSEQAEEAEEWEDNVTPDETADSAGEAGGLQEAEEIQQTEEEEAEREAESEREPKSEREPALRALRPKNMEQPQSDIGRQMTLPEQLLKEKCRMYPFEDNEIQACVRMEPQDLEDLGPGLAELGKNSFLMHGYFSYGHVIFAKRKTEPEKEIYMLGVPGMYRNQDRFLASMFGFPLFKGLKRKNIAEGDFGYWCREVF